LPSTVVAAVFTAVAASKVVASTAAAVDIVKQTETCEEADEMSTRLLVRPLLYLLQGLSLVKQKGTRV
jgi:hypothetical protein